MRHRRDLRRWVAELRARAKNCRFADATSLLSAAGATRKNRRGSHETWSHPLMPHPITLIDVPRGQLYEYVVKRACAYVEDILDLGEDR